MSMRIPERRMRGAQQVISLMRRSSLRYASIIALLMLLSACSFPMMEPVPVVDPGATLHLFLEPVPQEARSLSLSITSLNARTSGGDDIPLFDEPFVLAAAQRIGRQTKLVTRKLPPGDYKGLSIAIAKATQTNKEGNAALLVNTDFQLIPQTFTIKRDRANTLFLSMNSDRLVTDGYRLTVKFSVWTSQSPLTGLKGVISHPANGTLSFFEKKTPRIFSVLALGQRPRGLAFDQVKRRAYIALTDEDSVLIVDLIHERIERKVRLRSVDRPHGLTLSDGGRTLLVTNSGSNAISLIDTENFRERQRILFSTRPASVLTSSQTSRAYVTLPETNTLVLVDTDRGSVDASVSLPETPTKGIVSVDGKALYLLTETSPDILLVDAQTLQLKSRIFIGYGANCLAQTRGSLFYVGLESGKISVIDPRMELPIDHFWAGGPVTDLVPDLMENSLFVLTDQKLEKFDLISKKKQAVLDLGSAGFELSIMGEP